MQRYDAVFPSSQLHIPASIRRLDPATQHLERVDHNVAHKVNLVFVDTFPQQVRVRVCRWRPQQVSNCIGDQAIDLLGHAAIPATKACFEMYDWYPEFSPDHCARRRGVHVADDDNRVRWCVKTDLLVRNHHVARLFGMRAAANFEITVGFREFEITKERLGHIKVVVLSCMDYLWIAPRRSGQRVIKWRDFHEIRSGGCDQVHCFLVFVVHVGELVFSITR